MNAVGTEAVLCIVEITSKADGLGSKWTVHEGLTERLKKLTVKNKIRCSKRQTVKRDGRKDGRKGRIWILLEDVSGQPKKLKEDSPKDL